MSTASACVPRTSSVHSTCLSAALVGAGAFVRAAATTVVVSLSALSCTKTPPASAPRAEAKSEAAGESTPVTASPETSPWLVSDPPDLRALTFIVEVKPPEGLALAYFELGSRYKELRPLMEAHSEGGFGSGFLVVARGEGGPDAYVVTNQHVVGLSSRVVLRRDASSERVGVPVVYVDPVYDLAILRLSEEALRAFEVESGLGFSSRAARDQDAVVASGFPGIQGAPSYQVTRGNVSNERVLLEIGGDELVHIQHTAPIDPGSSGGPLLDESGHVVGINTLKIQWREGVGLAVPAPVVEAALAAVRTPLPSANRQAAARELCERLIAETSDGSRWHGADRLFGERLIAREGGPSLWLLPEDETDWLGEFVSDPARVMALALSFRLRRELGAAGAAFCTPQSAPSDALQSFVIERGVDAKASSEETIAIGDEQGVLKVLDFTFSPGSGRSFLDPKQSHGKKWTPSL